MPGTPSATVADSGQMASGRQPRPPAKGLHGLVLLVPDDPAADHALRLADAFERHFAKREMVPWVIMPLARQRELKSCWNEIAYHLQSKALSIHQDSIPPDTPDHPTEDDLREKCKSVSEFARKLRAQRLKRAEQRRKRLQALPQQVSELETTIEQVVKQTQRKMSIGDVQAAIEQAWDFWNDRGFLHGCAVVQVPVPSLTSSVVKEIAACIPDAVYVFCSDIETDYWREHFTGCKLPDLVVNIDPKSPTAFKQSDASLCMPDGTFFTVPVAKSMDKLVSKFVKVGPLAWIEPLHV